MSGRRNLLQALRIVAARLRGLRFRILLKLFCRDARVGPGLRCFGPVVLTHAAGARVRIGRGVVLGQGWLSVLPGARLEIGDTVGLNQCFTLLCSTEVTIGAETMIGELVSIRDQDHRFDRPEVPIREQGYTSAPIAIGRNVWIGRGAAILKGATIGDGAVIAANAVVTGDVPAGELWGGVPARRIRAVAGKAGAAP